MSISNIAEPFLAQTGITDNFIVNHVYWGFRVIYEIVESSNGLERAVAMLFSAIILKSLYRFTMSEIERTERFRFIYAYSNYGKKSIYALSALYGIVPATTFALGTYFSFKDFIDFGRVYGKLISEGIAKCTIGDRLLLMIGSAIVITQIVQKAQEIARGRAANSNLIYAAAGFITAFPAALFAVCANQIVSESEIFSSILGKDSFSLMQTSVQLFQKFTGVISGLSPIGLALVTIFTVGGMIAQKDLSCDILKAYPRIKDHTILKLTNHAVTTLVSTVPGIVFAVGTGMELNQALAIAAVGYGTAMFLKSAIASVQYAAHVLLSD